MLAPLVASTTRSLAGRYQDILFSRGPMRCDRGASAYRVLRRTSCKPHHARGSRGTPCPPRREPSPARRHRFQTPIRAAHQPAAAADAKKSRPGKSGIAHFVDDRRRRAESRKRGHQLQQTRIKAFAGRAAPACHIPGICSGRCGGMKRVKTVRSGWRLAKLATMGNTTNIQEVGQGPHPKKSAASAFCW